MLLIIRGLVLAGYVIVIAPFASTKCNNGRGDLMHEPKASVLRLRDRYCIIRVHRIKTLCASKWVHNCFSADHMTSSQPDSSTVL